MLLSRIFLGNEKCLTFNFDVRFLYLFYNKIANSKYLNFLQVESSAKNVPSLIWETIRLHWLTHRIKDDRMENYGGYMDLISK